MIGFLFVILAQARTMDLYQCAKLWTPKVEQYSHRAILALLPEKISDGEYFGLDPELKPYYHQPELTLNMAPQTFGELLEASKVAKKLDQELQATLPSVQDVLEYVRRVPGAESRDILNLGVRMNLDPDVEIELAKIAFERAYKFSQHPGEFHNLVDYWFGYVQYKRAHKFTALFFYEEWVYLLLQKPEKEAKDIPVFLALYEQLVLHRSVHPVKMNTLLRDMQNYMAAHPYRDLAKTMTNDFILPSSRN